MILDLNGLKEIFERLNGAEVSYIVVGGLAVISLGQSRTTTDVDLVLSPDRKNLEMAVGVFKGLGYRPNVPVPFDDFPDESKRRFWADEKHMKVFQLKNDDRRFPPIDLFLFSPFDYDVELGKALSHPIAEIDVVVPRPSTLLDMKLLANRPKDDQDIKFLQLLVTPDKTRWKVDNQ